MNRKKAGMFAVVGLSAAIVTGVATSAFAAGTSKAPQVTQSAPSSDQLVDRMAKELKLDNATKAKVSKLFATDGQAIRELQDKLNMTRRELSTLSPAKKGYMDKVDDLADKSGDLTEKLTIKYAKSRADLYALLTPQQIEKLENFGKPTAQKGG